MSSPMRQPIHRTSPRRHIATACLAALGLLAAWCAHPHAAGAAVRHGAGLEGTVLGWTSWYGNYDLAGIGTTYCIDHGSRAPDASYGYRATAAGLDRPTRTALAWVAGRYGTTPEAVDAAAVMLALHSLRGARYPYGILDAQRLRPSDLAGFEGNAAAVLARARVIEADGVAHRSLRWPLHLEVALTVPTAASADDATGKAAPEAPPSVTARVADAAGMPVSGVPVRFALHAAATDDTLVHTTGSDGSTTIALRNVSSRTAVEAEATVPDLRAAIYAPTSGAAQRVIRPRVAHLEASAPTTPAPPPTTTPPTSPPTTSPATTTPATTPPPATAPPTTAPATTVPVTTVAPTSTTQATPPPPTTNPAPPENTTTGPASPPASSLPSPASAVPLAHTGAAIRPWAMIACGVILIGAAALGVDLTVRGNGR